MVSPGSATPPLRPDAGRHCDDSRVAWTPLLGQASWLTSFQLVIPPATDAMPEAATDPVAEIVLDAPPQSRSGPSPFPAQARPLWRCFSLPLRSSQLLCGRVCARACTPQSSVGPSDSFFEFMLRVMLRQFLSSRFFFILKSGCVPMLSSTIMCYWCNFHLAVTYQFHCHSPVL